MEQKFRELINKMLLDCNSLKEWNETKTIHKEIHEEVSADNIATAPNGTPYKKKELSQYLLDKGLPFTEEYVNMAAKLFPAGDYELDSDEIVKHNEMENVSDEDLNTFVMAKLLEQLTKFRTDFLKKNFYDYRVEIVTDDSSGGTNLGALTRVLERYSDEGWSLKQVFVNELGTDSHTVGMINYNSTIDQVVLIFERPSYITDNLAKKIRNDIKNVNKDLHNQLK